MGSNSPQSKPNPPTPGAPLRQQRQNIIVGVIYTLKNQPDAKRKLEFKFFVKN